MWEGLQPQEEMGNGDIISSKDDEDWIEFCQNLWFVTSCCHSRQCFNGHNKILISSCGFYLLFDWRNTETSSKVDTNKMWHIFLDNFTLNVYEKFTW